MVRYLIFCRGPDLSALFGNPRRVPAPLPLLVALDVGRLGLLEVAHLLLHSLQFLVPDLLQMLPGPFVLDASGL